jgi:hypothetical protein
MPMVKQSLHKLPEPRKMDHRLLAVSKKIKIQDGECWQFAQWLCDYWHIAAVTAQYAKGLCP